MSCGFRKRFKNEINTKSTIPSCHFPSGSESSYHIIKTIKVSGSDNKEETDKEYQDIDAVTFKVQIGVYKQGSKLHDQEFKDVDAKEVVVNGTYKYFVGATSDTTIVSHLKEEMIKKGFTDAFIVAYKDGVRIKYSVQ